jgi:S-formylglutathione hydrolase
LQFFFLFFRLEKQKSQKMSQLKEVSANKCFNGVQKVFSHQSKEMKCEMNFAIYLPDGSADKKLPVLFWLSGLTCDHLNAVQKSGFQRFASEKGIIVVCPDTSPRNIKDLDTSGFDWDFGYGAGFYIVSCKRI